MRMLVDYPKLGSSAIALLFFLDGRFIDSYIWTDNFKKEALLCQVVLKRGEDGTPISVDHVLANSIVGSILSKLGGLGTGVPVVFFMCFCKINWFHNVFLLSIASALLSVGIFRIL